jgi:cytochrome b pre-mRNA-processing protein 3
MLKRFFGGPDVANPRSDSVYAGIVALARRPWLYSRAGVPDTVSGRFDMIVLHLALVMERLRDGGPAAQVFSQALLETMFADMDRNLRELGVGDLSIAKRMRAMASVYYGRAIAYREAFASTDPPAAVASRSWKAMSRMSSMAAPSILASWRPRSWRSTSIPIRESLGRRWLRSSGPCNRRTKNRAAMVRSPLCRSL